MAIAAPQIGESLRIFIVAARALEMIAEDTGDEGLIEKFTDQIYINPEIIKASKAI